MPLRAAEETPADAAEEEALPAGTLPYTTEIVPTGDDALDKAMADASQLQQLQAQSPTTAFGVIARAQGDRERFGQALHAEGYWSGRLRISIAGIPLDAPELADRLDAFTLRQAGGRADPVTVRIEAEKGPRYEIGRVTVSADSAAGEAAVAEATQRPFGLVPGDPARAAPILAAERTLLDRLLAEGHPLATLARREAVVDYDRRTLDVSWVFAPGPEASFAAPKIAGADRVDAGFLERFASHRLTGETYSPERLENARKDMMALGPFDSVRAEPGTALDAEGRLPVTFAVSERPRRAIGGSLAYETNYGPSVRVYWEHRNLWGGAERLRLEGEMARIGTAGGLGNSTYRAFATLRDPGVLGAGNDTLIASIGALRERLEAYNRDAFVASALIERRFSQRLSVTAGPTLDIGRTGPPDDDKGNPTGPMTSYQVIGLSFGGRYDGTDSLLDPARGWRLTGTLAPSYSISDQQPFAPTRITASTYWDVLGDRRSILALRGTVGSLLGANTQLVPRHLRFYAGGGGSVRGYDYQSIGPRDPVTNKPIGGGSLVEASLELRQRVWGDFGAVAFVDAGSVGSASTPDFSSLRVGVGVGVRYYTAIGPIRADIALPLVKQEGSSGYGLYVGIGQSF